MKCDICNRSNSLKSTSDSVKSIMLIIEDMSNMYKQTHSTRLLHRMQNINKMDRTN